MWTYIKCLLILVATIFIYGLLCPMLISYDETLPVVAGFVVAGLYPILVYISIKNVVKSIKEMLKK